MKDTHKNPPQGVKLFKERTIQLEAGSSYTVGLGTYAALKHESDFAIKSKPDIGSMLGTSLEMVEIPGSDRFMGLYHLHNFGNQSCDVTISVRTIRESGNERP